MSWSSHSNFDLNQAAQMKRWLQSSIPSSNLVFFQLNFIMAKAKMSTGSFLPGNLPTYEFYNPSFVACQFCLGQLPHQLFFKNMLKPREGISEVIEASRVFQLGSDLPSFCLHDWTRVNFSSNLFDSWCQEWHSHLFCGSVHPRCIALDGDFASNSEVTYYCFFRKNI